MSKETIVAELLGALKEQTLAVLTMKVNEMRIKYGLATSAPKGVMIFCPYCGRAFKKKTHNQKFCLPECRIAFWNIIRELDRIERRIS